MSSIDTREIIAVIGDGMGGSLVPTIAAVVVIAVLISAWLGSAAHRSGPRVGELWFAEVPFRTGPGSKDRPVLVLSVDGRDIVVAPFTSQDKTGRPGYAHVPRGFPGLSRDSWISTSTVLLRRSAMRRRTGYPGPAVVEWYLSAVGV